MIKPPEFEHSLNVKLDNGVLSASTKVWEILTASRDGDLDRVKGLVDECLPLAAAQYNYTPPLHFAVREGHADLTAYLLELGALDPSYTTYPFKESLLTVARERGYDEIGGMLETYLTQPDACRFHGDNGEFLNYLTDQQLRFQKAVNHNDMAATSKMLESDHGLAKVPSLSWWEGILAMPSNRGNVEMLDLLYEYGATVPTISKWGREYYFKHPHIAKYHIEHGMDPNHTTWHGVTMLHNMAQLGAIDRARLLIDAGAELSPIEDEYRSTPLGMASRWGHVEMVEYLLEQGADPDLSGAEWSTPLAWSQVKGHAAVESALRSAGAC